MDVKELSIRSNCSIKNGLEQLNLSGLGTLFVINESDELIGILTDGDIRRALLKGYVLEDEIKFGMNPDFVSLPIETENAVILNAISDRIRLIPLVDEANTLIDYASITKIRRISVANPLLTGNELAYITDCIRTNWISSQGKYVRQFEELFTQYHHGYPALAVSNGTVALHLAMEALNIGPGDEVIVPDLTFAACVNAIIYTGATPVLVDVQRDTWTIDIEKAASKITTKTKAIMPVHLYGHPCEMDEVMQLAKEHNLLVIEDCAEALGSYYKNNPVGILGDVATFSFYGNKTITTGEGGMVIFKSKDIADRAAMLRDHGMKKSRRYWHEEVGYNYRLTNIQAAIGVAQFERLNEFVALKRKIAKTYNSALVSIPFFQLPIERPDVSSSYWLYTFIVLPEAPFTRDELIEYLSKKGIETRPVFFSMHLMPPYCNFGNVNDLIVSRFISDNGISLPSSVNLTDIELLYITNTLKEHCLNSV